MLTNRSDKTADLEELQRMPSNETIFEHLKNHTILLLNPFHPIIWTQLERYLKGLPPSIIEDDGDKQ